jgi:hypothetical protein
MLLTNFSWLIRARNSKYMVRVNLCWHSGARVCDYLRELSTLVNEGLEMKAVVTLVILWLWKWADYLDGQGVKWMSFLHIVTKNLLWKMYTYKYSYLRYCEIENGNFSFILLGYWQRNKLVKCHTWNQLKMQPFHKSTY